MFGRSLIGVIFFLFFVFTCAVVARVLMVRAFGGYVRLVGSKKRRHCFGSVGNNNKMMNVLESYTHAHIFLMMLCYRFAFIYRKCELLKIHQIQCDYAFCLS